MSTNRKMLKSLNPKTLEVLGEVELMTSEEITQAVSRSQAAFPGWAGLPVEDRMKKMYGIRDYILAHLDEIAQLISDEQGKPLAEAMSADILPALQVVGQYAGRYEKLTRDERIPIQVLKGLKSSRIVYRPHGVVAIIAPWNFPFSIPLSGILFALMTGNTVLFKPASEVPIIGKMIARCVIEGGQMPEDVFQLILASGRDVGDSLFKPPIRRVVFTGSTDTGKWIQKQCANHLIPCSLELGGKDPMVVLEDADLDMAVRGALWGAFTNCGQVCASVERLYVARPIYDRFVEKLVAEVGKLRIGVPPVDDYDIGPLNNEAQRLVVEEHVRDAVAGGAQVLCGGKRPEGAVGYFYEPTVLVNVNHDMKVMREETFGPLCPVMPFDTEDEAVALANDSNFGLTASVWSRDLERADDLARRIESGTVVINDHGYTYALVETPWQGMKESGLGASHSVAGLKEFLFPQHINVDNVPQLRRRMWWYPYDKDVFALFKEFADAIAHPSKLPGFASRVLTRKRWRSAVLG